MSQSVAIGKSSPLPLLTRPKSRADACGERALMEGTASEALN